MFGPLKEALGGQRFDNDEQVENFVPIGYRRVILLSRTQELKSPNPLAKMHRERWKLCR